MSDDNEDFDLPQEFNLRRRNNGSPPPDPDVPEVDDDDDVSPGEALFIVLSHAIKNCMDKLDVSLSDVFYVLEVLKARMMKKIIETEDEEIYRDDADDGEE